MADVYEVAFIRKAFIKNGKFHYRIHWAGWKTQDETDEPATSVALYGTLFNKFWFSFIPEEIYKTKRSVSLKQELIKKHLEAESTRLKDSQLYNPGPIGPPPPNGLSTAGTDVESTSLEPPYPDAMVVDPQVLWLPPDRIGQPVDDPELLFKIVVNALASEGIKGYEFYQHLKRDRKDFGQKWFEQQECTICTFETIQTVLTCPTRAVGYCGPCTVRLLLASREEFPAGKLQCPCCRQIGYLISKEWVFAQNEKARDEYKKQYKKEKNWMRKAKAKEEKLAREYEESEIEEESQSEPTKCARVLNIDFQFPMALSGIGTDFAIECISRTSQNAFEARNQFKSNSKRLKNILKRAANTLSHKAIKLLVPGTIIVERL
ncbi:hypothetical protein BT96DRAFT_1005522 [Gymnopus androsaceus JB14]|uniref:Chromo domain-containing protein n=1 Tax=Gymnopus androsaceus JB14 TaxID=1447944 RepID=A0A6A4GMP3_9AGAR|nr:hypothetical protein BT96DRAFT_1005522 [Gymnopus androsaceus JB14]